ncbi:serine/threonine protein kinase [Sulfolobus acidocaldarius]|nr:serine/threonine protein kinase [Sulfolobus acidocaldarius]
MFEENMEYVLKNLKFAILLLKEVFNVKEVRVVMDKTI